MKKITIWLTATAAAIALVIAYQLNAAGVGAKAGGDDRPPPAATSTAAPAAGGTPAPSSPSTSNSDSGDSGHTPKPGENK